MAAAGASQVTIAQKTWEMSNNIMEVRKQSQWCRSALSLLFEGWCWRRDLQVRQTTATEPSGGEAMGEGSSLLQGAVSNLPLLHLPFAGHQDLCFGTVEDGDARKVRGQFGDHGTVAWKGWWRVAATFQQLAFHHRLTPM